MNCGSECRNVSFVRRRRVDVRAAVCSARVIAEQPAEPLASPNAAEIA